MKKKVLNLLILMSLIFTVVTFFESSIQLALGTIADKNVHILNRLSYSFIGATSITLVREINTKKIILDIFVPYLIMLPLMVLSVYITSLYMFMPDTAYRDALLFFTVIFFIVGGIIEKRKREYEKEKQN